MSSDTYFLRPVVDETSDPSFADAFAFSDLFSFSHTPLDVLVATDAITLVNQGTALAMAEATASGVSDGIALTDLFSTTASTGAIVDGASQVWAEAYAEITASFDIATGETFTFDFDVLSELGSKEIEDPDREYTQATVGVGFFVLETSDVAEPELLGYFASLGALISSESYADLETGHHVTDGQGQIEYLQDSDIDIGQDNDVDYISSFSSGFYEQQFQTDSHVTIVQFNSNLVELRADTLIDRLGPDVTYGTIWDDTLSGGGKIYASLGDDKVYGQRGDDILEGGQGNDTLEGRRGDDRLHGGIGHDNLVGGRGNDFLLGGGGNDTLAGNRGNDILESGAGDDILRGGRGRDSLDGGDGSDVIFGGRGKDLLRGGAGNDALDGGRGHDQLFGDDGNDTLRGRSGKDLIVGGLGDDEMYGGKGADAFLFVKGESLILSEADVVGDFQAGRDTIMFQGWGAIDEEAWLAEMAGSGQAVDIADGVQFFLEDDASLSLFGSGLSLTSLSGSDFEFV